MQCATTIPWRSAVMEIGPGTSDEEILRYFVAGEREAFRHLILRHQNLLFSYFLRSTRNRASAEELTQDTFLRATKAAQHFRGDAKVKTWLSRIARNLAIDHARKQKHRRHASLEAPVGGSSLRLLDTAAGPKKDSPERRAIGESLQKDLNDAISDLPRDQKEVFLMRQYQGHSFVEISEILGLSENTVKSRMRYALTKLRSALMSYAEHAGEIG